MKLKLFLSAIAFAGLFACSPALFAQTPAEPSSASSAPATTPEATPIPRIAPAAYPIQEGFIDSRGVLIYYLTIGRGAPLVIVHGGPGASHD